jgi:hypothetical protein
VLAWLLDLGFAARRFGTPAPQVGTAESPAGRPRRRSLYFVTIDGERFECGSLAQALDKLALAKSLALQRARERTREATELQQRQLKRIARLELVPPRIAVPPALRAVVAEIRREIEVIYEKADVDIEIAILMELNKRRDDDNDVLMLLM